MFRVRFPRPSFLLIGGVIAVALGAIGCTTPAEPLARPLPTAASATAAAPTAPASTRAPTIAPTATSVPRPTITATPEPPPAPTATPEPPPTATPEPPPAATPEPPPTPEPPARLTADWTDEPGVVAVSWPPEPNLAEYRLSVFAHSADGITLLTVLPVAPDRHRTLVTELDDAKAHSFLLEGAGLNADGAEGATIQFLGLPTLIEPRD